MRTFSTVGVVAAFAVLASSSASAVTLNPAFTGVSCAAPVSFTRSVGLGARGADIMDLQKILNLSSQTQVSLSGAGSPGLETQLFGPATRAAVRKFQALHGVPTTGFVGPLTRGYLNMVCTTASNNNNNNPVVVTPVTGPVSVAAAPVQPNAVLIAGQSNANLGEFVFTGNGTISSIEFMRIGASSNNAISNVYLYEGATRLTDASSILTTGAIRFNVPMTVNGSRRISVRGDVALGMGSQVVGVALTGMTLSGSTTATPVVGVSSGLQTIANAELATANFTTTGESPADATINAGSMNQNLWSNSLNVGLRAVKLKGFSVKMIGSAPTNSLANVGLFVNGSRVASATGADANGRFVFDMMMNPVNLTTGAHLIEVRADVVGGANRNFYMVLEQATDIMVEDSQLAGANLTVTRSPNNQQILNMRAGLVTINNGTLVVSQDTTFNNTTTVVGGATNVRLAAFRVTSFGEDVRVNSLTFNPVFTGLNPAGTKLANVGLYVNGGQVSTQQNVTSGTNFTFNNLGSNLIANTGVPVTVEIRGDVVNPDNNVAYTAGQVRFDLVDGSSNAQGVQSSQLTNTPGAGGQSLTVSSSNVTLSNTAGFADSTRAPNTSDVRIGSFTVNTASAEGVVVTNVAVNLIPGTSGDSPLMPLNQITNLTIRDGNTVVGTPIGNPVANGNNFSANITVPPSSTRVLDVFANFGSSATGTIRAAMQITTRGATSNLTGIVPASPVNGPITTAATALINAGNVTFVPASSPVAQYVVAGNQNLGIANFNFRTANNVGGGIIRDVTFTVSPNTISSVTMNGKTAAVVGTTAILYDVNLTVPADNSGVNVPVSVALVCASQGQGCAGVSNSDLFLTISNVTYNNGSNVVSVAPSVSTPTHKLVATRPTVSVSNTTGGGFTNANLQIGTITVAADAAGDIRLERLPVTITVAGAGLITADSVQLRDSAGTSVIVGTGGTNGTQDLDGSGTFEFTSPRTITRGTSETYTVWATFTNVSGNAGTQSVTFQAGNRASFRWTDVAGNVSNLDGSLINNYPTSSQTRSN